MKIVIIGGSGLIGSKVVTRLREHGHDAVPASPNSGVNTLTGEGLAGVLGGAAVVVDVSNSPSFEDTAVLKFFQTSTGNLLAAEAAAGVGHHVALSVVGSDRAPDSGYLRAKIAQEKLIRNSSIPYSIVRATQFFETSTANLLAAEAAAGVGHHVALSVGGSDRAPDSGYLRAKIAQEKLIRNSSIPYSIVRATQFFEFLKRIADEATDGNTVHIAPVLFQPIAATDVAIAVCRVAVGAPLNRIVEVAGPQQFRFDEFIRLGLGARQDPRVVIADSHARYFGTEPGERTLVPGADASLGEIRFEDWLAQSTVHAAPA